MGWSELSRTHRWTSGAYNNNDTRRKALAVWAVSRQHRDRNRCGNPPDVGWWRQVQPALVCGSGLDSTWRNAPYKSVSAVTPPTMPQRACDVLWCHGALRQAVKTSALHIRNDLSSCCTRLPRQTWAGTDVRAPSARASDFFPAYIDNIHRRPQGSNCCWRHPGALWVAPQASRRKKRGFYRCAQG